MMREWLFFIIEWDENFFDKLNEWIGDVFYDYFSDVGLEFWDE